MIFDSWTVKLWVFSSKFTVKRVLELFLPETPQSRHCLNSKLQLTINYQLFPQLFFSKSHDRCRSSILESIIKQLSANITGTGKHNDFHGIAFRALQCIYLIYSLAQQSNFESRSIGSYREYIYSWKNRFCFFLQIKLLTLGSEVECSQIFIRGSVDLNFDY